MFGSHFLSLDWDNESERIYGFETFKDLDDPIDLVTALPDNSYVLFYSKSLTKMWALERKKKGSMDRVYESYSSGPLLASRHASLQKLLAKQKSMDEDYEDRGPFERHFMKVIRSRFDFVENIMDRVGIREKPHKPQKIQNITDYLIA